MPSVEIQGRILDAGKESGLLTAEVVDSCRGSRDRPGGMPPLKMLLERQGVSKAALDRILEKFWAQNGARRGQLHREVEDRLAAQILIEAGHTGDSQVDAALKVVDEREKGGQAVRVLSILIDAGAVTEEQGKAALAELQERWRFCRYCLSTFTTDAPGDACGVCWRPLVPCGRNYEIVKIETFTGETSKNQAVRPVEFAPPPEVGESLAGVKLLERVDSKGRGLVYRAERLNDQAPRAVKVWPLGKEMGKADVSRFESAALASAKLDHPGILKVFEAGEERGIHFSLAEWVEGRTLARVVADGGPLAPERAQDVLVRLAKALQAAHASSLLHKNVTPENIFILDDGEVKIGDFGVAKEYGVSLDTVRGNVIGSPDYLAPEQCEGKKADERTDVFSLGATVYFALTGRKPYEAESNIAIVVKRLTTDPKPIASLAPRTPPGLVQVVERMMARKPDDRPASMAAVVEAVEKWRSLAADEAATSPGGRRRGLLVAIVLLLIACGGGAGGAWWWTHRGPGPDLIAAVNGATARRRRAPAGPRATAARREGALAPRRNRA
ncbi:MAG: serine/threonine protein kinase, partial [Polyangiaceae bacterium]